MNSTEICHQQSTSQIPMDITKSLVERAGEYPEKLVLADSITQLTWQQFNHRLDLIANTLISLGIQPNQRIAILARNSINYATLFLGGLRAGICIVPLSTLASGESLAGMINDSEANCFLSPTITAISSTLSKIN